MADFKGWSINGGGSREKIKESVHFLQHPIVISFTQHETLLKKENVCIKVFFFSIFRRS